MPESLSHTPLLQPLLSVVACLLAGIIVRWLSMVAIRRLCNRTHAVDGDMVASYAGRAILWTSLFIGLDFFVPASLIAPTLQSYTHPFLLSLCIIVCAIAVARIIGSMVQRVSERKGHHVGTASLFQNSLKFAIYLLAFILICDAFGIKVTTFIATLGIGGLALALALQETLTNLFAGMYITVANQIRVGDHVAFDGHEGTVTDIGWRTTLIRKLDESILIAPNSKLSQALVTTTSYDAKAYRGRLVLQLGIDEDLSKAEDLLKRIVQDAMEPSSDSNSSTIAIHQTPPPIIRVGEIKDGYAELVLMLSVSTPAQYAELRSALVKSIMKIFAENSIRFHNPQRR